MRRTAVALVPALLFALLLSASHFRDGFYDDSWWAALTVASAVLVLALLCTGTARLSLPAAMATGALAALAGWSALSVTWAESADQAWTEANRFGFYAIVFALFAIAVRRVGHGRVVLAVVGGGAALVALYVEARLLLGSGAAMFSGFRLGEPLRYVNGQAAVLLMAVWPLVAVAEGRSRPALRGAALGLAVLVCDLLVLTQSRSALLALGVSAALLLAFVPGRLTRAWALAFVAAGVGASLPVLVDVYGEFAPNTSRLPTDAVVSRAGTATLLSSLAAGAAWGLARAMLRRLPRVPIRRIAAVTLLSVAGAAVLVGAASDPLVRAEREYERFRTLDYDASPAPRFTSAGGYRHDLWRIGAVQFANAPLTGVGAGNYDTTYYLERRQPDNVRQPHSLPLQVLGELGIVGGAGLLLFVAAVYAGALAPPSRTLARADRAVLVAGVGIFTVWLVQTSVDWIFNLPGTTGLALAAAAVLLGSPAAGNAGRGGGGKRRGPWVAAAVAAVGLVAVSASAGVRYGADRERDHGESQLRSDPERALSHARRSLDLNPESLRSAYLEAAAHARLGRYARARAALLRAAAKEPRDHVPWTLLGDLAARRGDWPRAARAYRRAASLNPLDRHLASLARDPQVALRGPPG